jgi:uncharacterized protein HemY
MMLRKLKLFLGLGTCIVFSLWWFGVNNQSMEENFYSKEEYHQDLSKIYFDLGRSAERRKDFQAAIRAYRIALEHQPDLSEANANLSHCLKSTSSLHAALL